jgi:hypothetical protein
MKKIVLLTILFSLFISVNFLFAQTAYPYARPGRAEILAALNTKNPNHEHPRLYVRSADIAALRQRIASDPQMKSWYVRVLATADRTINLDKTPYAWRDNQTSPLSRSVPGRLYALSFVYQITWEKKYADRAIQELEAIAGWPDWGIRPDFLSALADWAVCDSRHHFAECYEV